MYFNRTFQLVAGLIGLVLRSEELEARSPRLTRMYTAIRNVAVQSETLGFDSLWLNDHLMSTASGGRSGCLECWTTLAALAAETKRIRLGSMATCNSYRHPALLAKMTSALDNISNGRLDLGIGAGWYEREHVAYGFDFLDPISRVKMLQESITLIKRMWTEDKVTFVGTYYRTKEAFCEPKPIQKPHPPIWVAGSALRVLRLAARHAYGCNFAGDPTEFSSKLELLRGYCLQVDRNYNDLRKSLYCVVVLGGNEREARKRLTRFLSTKRGPLPQQVDLAIHHPEAVYHYLKNRFVDRKLPPGWIVGTPEQCTARLLEYVNIGVENFMVDVVDAMNPHTLQMFADEVAVHLDLKRS